MRFRIAPYRAFRARTLSLLPAGLGLLALGGAILPAPAQASHITMSGDSVDLTAPCMGHVVITVDPNLKDGASLDSSNSTQVTIHDDKDGAESKITVATRSCEPNGKLSLRLAPDTGLSIHDSHDSHFTITGTLASLDASLDSDTLDVETVQSLDLSMHGSSTVHITSLNRAAQIVASGTSTFMADNAQLSALSAQLTNNTAFTINGGSIEALTVVTADQATATILGSATIATVTANGSGVVNIEKVTGPLVRSGSGSLRVGAPNGEIYRPSAPPPETSAVTAQAQNASPSAAPAQSAPAQSVPAQLPQSTPGLPPQSPPTPDTPATATPAPSAPPVAPATPVAPTAPTIVAQPQPSASPTTPATAPQAPQSPAASQPVQTQIPQGQTSASTPVQAAAPASTAGTATSSAPSQSATPAATTAPQIQVQPASPQVTTPSASSPAAQPTGTSTPATSSDKHQG